MNSYEIAIAMYERALQIFARYAGKTSETKGTPIAPALANQAELLALPGQRIDALSPLPVLVSIMGRLHGQPYTEFYQPQRMDPTTIMPAAMRPTTLSDDYGQLWAQFQQERQQVVLSQQKAPVQEANLHALLQRYTWSVPAPLLSTNQDNSTDISLYDYARISAALAVCLSQSGDDPAAILIGGDVSGVQEWLYTFGSTGAARSLRGRSFYLQLLSEIIAHYVLERLGLPMANLLYAGGGNFYILAPPQAAQTLLEIRREISRKLMKMHDGALYVALAHTSIEQAMLLGKDNKRVTEAWTTVSRKLNRQKMRRFTELDQDEMASVIGAARGWSGRSEHTCAVCRRTILRNEQAAASESDPEQYTCAQCQSFQRLGNALRHAEFLVVSQIDATTNETVTDWQQGLRQFGYDVQLVYLSTGRQAHNTQWQPPPTYQATRIYFWEDQTPALHKFPGHPDPQRTIWSYRPLAKCIPLILDDVEDGWRIADFDQLQSDGINRWGVLRMDVDSLGAIFREGITSPQSTGPSVAAHTSFSRLVGVSGLLRLFFEGYVPRLAERYNAQGPRMYLMYAGGDDLFVVGGWSDLPNLAQEIRREFGRFVCGNPRVTISGGVAIAPDKKYPLYQMATEAGEAEDQAKHYRPQKDAFSFMGQPMAWGDEYNAVKNYVDQITTWLGQGNRAAAQTERAVLPRSFLNILRSIDATWREWKAQEEGEQTLRGIQPRYQHTDKILYLGPWQWHLIYSLHQAAERTGNSVVKRDVKELIDFITKGGIQSIGTIARWAELLTRSASQAK